MPIDAVAAWLIPGIGLASGLIATYVSLENRALLAEVRKELAELESRIILCASTVCTSGGPNVSCTTRYWRNGSRGLHGRREKPPATEAGGGLGGADAIAA